MSPDKKRIAPKVVTPVSDAEWALAEKFFKDNPFHPKFVRKIPSKKSKIDPVSANFLQEQGAPEGIAHSFVKIGNQIFALQAKVYLGAGAFGAVKRGYTKEGGTFAVKILLGGIDAEKTAEHNTLEALGRAEGMLERTLPTTKKIQPKGAHKPILYTKKTVIIDQFIPGKDLLKAIKSNNYSDAEKLEIAIKCAQIIKHLNDNHILHGDIALRNFMITDEGNVFGIDFGNALRLTNKEEGVQFVDVDFKDLKYGGSLNQTTIYNVVPVLDDGVRMHETFDAYCFSDVLKDLGITIDCGEKAMDNFDPLTRPVMSEVILALEKKQLELSAEQADLSELGFDVSDIDMPDVPPEFELSGSKDEPMEDAPEFDLSDLSELAQDIDWSPVPSNFDISALEKLMESAAASDPDALEKLQRSGLPLERPISPLPFPEPKKPRIEERDTPDKSTGPITASHPSRSAEIPSGAERGALHESIRKHKREIQKLKKMQDKKVEDCAIDVTALDLLAEKGTLSKKDKATQQEISENLKKKETDLSSLTHIISQIETQLKKEEDKLHILGPTTPPEPEEKEAKVGEKRKRPGKEKT